MEAATKEIEYYDDEELDRFAGRAADDYTDDEVEELWFFLFVYYFFLFCAFIDALFCLRLYYIFFILTCQVFLFWACRFFLLTLCQWLYMQHSVDTVSMVVCATICARLRLRNRNLVGGYC